MNTLDERTQYLLHQYTTGTCTPGEYSELLSHINIQTDNTLLENYLQQVIANSEYHPAEDQVNWEKMLAAIMQQQPVEKNRAPVRSMRSFKRIAVAVAVVVLLVTGALSYFLLLKNKKTKPGEHTVAMVNDVEPGRQGAVLTLGDGQTIVLDSTRNGALTKQGDVHIVKHDSLLSYQMQAGNIAITYNTLTTQRGRQFQLLLADGTKAWLNAASSIRFPTAFAGNERKVEITGEVYFEVAKNAAKPFIVTANNTEVKVLGTHFNINAYTDENLVTTTLLEGRVSVQSATGSNKPSILQPGQQAQAHASGTIAVVNSVNVDEVMAWKNGYFQFEKAGIQTVMRQISRWYDVDIEYQGEISNDKFGGSIPRDASLATVLHALEQSLVHFTIQGKKVIVTQ
jgi:ferric-dicitrate binding protein FerR (iron transport regulator)